MSLTTENSLASAREFMRQGRDPEAEAVLNSVLRHEPKSLSARLLLAILYFRSQRYSESVPLLISIREIDPDQLDATGLLAIILKERGEFETAIPLFNHIIQLGRRTVEIYNSLGACSLALGDAVSAGRAFRQAIELDRSVAHSFYNLGMALKLAGRSYETFATFKRASELDPAFFDTYAQIWIQMRQLLNWREGLPILEQGVRLYPDSNQLTIALAATYGKLGRKFEAERLFKSAWLTDDLLAAPYAHWLQEEGRFDESIPILKDSIAKEPNQGQAYYNLAVAKCFEIDGSKLSELIDQVLARESVEADNRMFLHYTLAKSFESERDYRLAMSHYDSANLLAYELYNGSVAHDPVAVEGEHLALQKLYSAETLKRVRSSGLNDPTPIFIVGMIRTGTTLLDQILSSHAKIKSAGEQPYWQVSSGRVNRRWMETGINPKDLQELGSRYLEVIRESAGESPRITDKMPTNFIHIGLMGATFPNSKFVHIRRNPLDTCLSIYTTFLGRGTQFAYDQANIVAYYRQYLRVMEHWRKVVPKDQLIEIDYEDLVANKETVLRQLLDFCGLEWDEACLYHEQNLTQVSTPSLWTARQPVNNKSVNRWKSYEPYMGKLLELKNEIHPPATGSST